MSDSIFGVWMKVDLMLDTNFHLFKDFLNGDDHKLLLEYVKSDIDFQPTQDNLSAVRFKQVAHASDPSISYLRPYVQSPTDTGEYDYYPTVIDWSYFRHYPTDDKIKQVIAKIEIMSMRAIVATFDIHPRGIYNNFLLKYSEGRGLRMHTDTYEKSIGTEYVAASFSTVYYINDDFEGGEFNAPFLGITLKPRANTMVLLNNIANEISCHEVTKVISGERYSWQQVWEVG